MWVLQVVSISNASKEKEGYYDEKECNEKSFPHNLKNVDIFILILIELDFTQKLCKQAAFE